MQDSTDLLDGLRGRRVLLVEDDAIVAGALRRDLEGLGAEVIGPIPTLARAVALCESATAVDVASLDVSLRDELVFPLADLLVARGIPFVFVTGFDAAPIPERLRQVERLVKPVEGALLAQSLAGAVRAVG